MQADEEKEEKCEDCINVADSEWKNEGVKVMEEIENCRRENAALKDEQCVTEWNCLHSLKTVNISYWLQPDSSAWVTLTP